MTKRYVVESDWDRECDYLMDTEHPGYADKDNRYDSDAVVVVISYDAPEDVTFNRNLKPLIDLMIRIFPLTAILLSRLSLSTRCNHVL